MTSPDAASAGPTREGTDPADPVVRFLAAVQSGVPEIYFNGMAHGLSHSDVFSVLERNGRAVAVLNMSYTTAKTLSIMLGQIISQFEELTDRDILTTIAVEKAFSEKKTQGGNDE